MPPRVKFLLRPEVRALWTLRMEPCCLGRRSFARRQDASCWYLTGSCSRYAHGGFELELFHNLHPACLAGVYAARLFCLSAVGFGEMRWAVKVGAAQLALFSVRPATLAVALAGRQPASGGGDRWIFESWSHAMRTGACGSLHGRRREPPRKFWAASCSAMRAFWVRKARPRDARALKRIRCPIFSSASRVARAKSRDRKQGRQVTVVVVAVGDAVEDVLEHGVEAGMWLCGGWEGPRAAATRNAVQIGAWDELARHPCLPRDTLVQRPG